MSKATCIDANNDGNWEERLIVGKEARIEWRSEIDLYDCMWMRSIVNNVNRPPRRYLWISNWKQSRLNWFVASKEQPRECRVNLRLGLWEQEGWAVTQRLTFFLSSFYFTEVELYRIRVRLNKNCSSWLESRLICVLIWGCRGIRCRLWCAKEYEGRGSMSYLWCGLRRGWWMPRLEININDGNGKTETDAFSK